MGRVVKPKLKLIDLFHKWQEARAKLDEMVESMSVYPGAVDAEAAAYKELYQRLQECNI